MHVGESNDKGDKGTSVGIRRSLLDLDELSPTDDIYADAHKIIDACQGAAYKAVNIALIHRNWLLGRRIAMEELHGGGENYGKSVMKSLSTGLRRDYGDGYSERNLYSYV